MPAIVAAVSRCALLCCCVVLLWVGAERASALDLPPELVRVMQANKLSSKAVSLLVQAVDGDTPRLALNAEVPRNPASTIKLITTWTALDMLGPNHTWPTRIYALGPINNGVLKGDLLIKGYGDPHLVLEDFWKMLGELRRAGVRDIQGDLLLDDSLFAIDEFDAAAFDGDGFRLYNVLPSALMVNFKALEFIIQPNARDGTVAVRAVPELPNLKITSHIKLTKGPCSGGKTIVSMSNAAPASPDHIVFSGSMPFACKGLSLNRSAMTPESYAYGAFKLLWQQWGGTISGGFRRATLPAKRQPLVTWRSRELGEIIRPLNKWSNNLMTRMLLYSLGEARYPAPVTRVQGVKALREHLDLRGLDTSMLTIDNGSGLSRDTRVTARLMVDVLRLAWAEPTMPEFVASLSIAGKDGTTRKRFRNGRESGRMHLKTGSLNGVAAIAGYVHAPSGRTFAVTMLIDTKGANWGAGRALQDALLAWTFRQQ